MPQTIEALILFLFFIVPGFIAREIISFRLPRKVKSDFESFLDYLVLGTGNLVFNLFVFFIIHLLDNNYSILLSNSLSENINRLFGLSPLLFVLLILLYVFILPYCIGTLLSLIQGFIYERSKFNFYQNAWDEFINKTDPVCLYIIMKNEDLICGNYGNNSFVSTAERNRDVFLEKEVLLDKSGQILGVIKDSKGIYVRLDEIAYFRVLSYIEEEE
ncbi:MAG: hypothetical protein A2014_01370 [Spirochaetes bacterium GWF1_49_6]|nr:MAG: hypothetical protein A2014_01370 [Spirochaetes bacterium GWF1_49_6]